MISSGLFDLQWWAYPMVALGLTHVTIAAVTIYLHRHQTHRALDLHPSISHWFRFWLWLTTGMVTREWVAVHRKHHARCETPQDPHSPQVLGIARVLWGGVFLYVREARDRELVERYGPRHAERLDRDPSLCALSLLRTCRPWDWPMWWRSESVGVCSSSRFKWSGYRSGPPV
jgi:fatty-acid desaturase